MNVKLISILERHIKTLVNLYTRSIEEEDLEQADFYLRSLGVVEKRLELEKIKLRVDTEKCPNCQEEIIKDDITEYQGKVMCAGCAETADLCSHDDPHGKNWS